MLYILFFLIMSVATNMYAQQEQSFEAIDKLHEPINDSSFIKNMMKVEGKSGDEIEDQERQAKSKKSVDPFDPAVCPADIRKLFEKDIQASGNSLRPRDRFKLACYYFASCGNEVPDEKTMLPQEKSAIAQRYYVYKSRLKSHSNAQQFDDKLQEGLERIKTMVITPEQKARIDELQEKINNPELDFLDSAKVTIKKVYKTSEERKEAKKQSDKELQQKARNRKKYQQELKQSLFSVLAEILPDFRDSSHFKRHMLSRAHKSIDNSSMLDSSKKRKSSFQSEQPKKKFVSLESVDTQLTIALENVNKLYLTPGQKAFIKDLQDKISKIENDINFLRLPNPSTADTILVDEEQTQTSADKNFKNMTLKIKEQFKLKCYLVSVIEDILQSADNILQSDVNLNVVTSFDPSSIIDTLPQQPFLEMYQYPDGLSVPPLEISELLS